MKARVGDAWKPFQSVEENIGRFAVGVNAASSGVRAYPSGMDGRRVQGEGAGYQRSERDSTA